MKKYIITLSVLIISIVGYFYFKAPAEVKYDFFVAEKSDLVQEVSVRGQVKPLRSVDLAFEVTGKTTGVYVNVGDKVKKGQKLIEVSNDELIAELLEQQAILEAKNAKLAEVRKGPRIEEIDVQKTKIQKSITGLKDTENILIDRLNEAYTEAEYAIYDKSDSLFNSPRTKSPRLSFAGTDSKLRSNVNNERFFVGQMLEAWKKKLDEFFPGEDLVPLISETQDNLKQVKSFLDKLSLIITALNSSSSLSQSSIDTWKNDIATARSGINIVISNISSTEEKWNTGKSLFQLERKELDLIQSGSTSEQIMFYEAEVKSAEARIRNINARLAKTILYSPINGVITMQDAKEGEVVSIVYIETPLVSINSENYEIEANIPEIDIAKVKVKDSVKITFDASDEEFFEGDITSIDPAETMIQGVVYYKAKIKFDLEAISIIVRPGMSADIDILTDRREQVLSVPQRIILSENGDKYLRILEAIPLPDGKTAKQTKKVRVKTGLKGTNGRVEIIEGLKVGDKVVISSNN